MNVHEDHAGLQELLDSGWVEVGRVHYEGGVTRINLEAPSTTCLHRLRPWDVSPNPKYNNGVVREEQYGYCLLAKGHKGKRHSTVVFNCDVCGRTLRGAPSFRDEHVVACFLCARGLHVSHV